MSDNDNEIEPVRSGSIDSLSKDEAVMILHRLAKRAVKEHNLSLVLGSNGHTGRLATGNSSLIAKATGLSRVHVGKVLCGKVGASHKTLLKIANATGLDVGQISGYITRAEVKIKT